MSETAMRYVKMPPTGKYPNGHQLPLRDRMLVVIGANGAGKTRLPAPAEMPLSDSFAKDSIRTS